MTEQEETAFTQEREENVRARMPSTAWQTGVGLFVVLCAVLWALGVLAMPAPTPWSGGGARLVPALCAALLLVCGVWLVWEARHGGWRNAAALSGYVGLQVTPWIWVSAGLLLGGGLIGVLGFIVSGALCYVLVVQGLRLATDEAARNSAQRWLADIAWGLGFAALIFVLFTKVLGIVLPVGGLLWK